MREGPLVETVDREHFDALVGGGEVSVFRYTPNTRGFYFLQICSASLFIVSYMVYLLSEFDPGYWAVASGFLALLGILLIALVVRWTTYAKRCSLAFDDEALYVVGARHVERIPWSGLSIENAGFSEQDENGDHGTLKMRLDGRAIIMRLFNPYVWIEDFPVLLVEILSQIKSNNEQNDDQGIPPTESESM